MVAATAFSYKTVITDLSLRHAVTVCRLLYPSASGASFVVASFSSQFSVLLISLKLNERHWHFFKHMLKHSFQTEKLKVSKIMNI